MTGWLPTLITWIGLAFVIWVVLVALFAPAVPYPLDGQVDATSSDFVTALESICQTRLMPGNRIDILTNGDWQVEEARVLGDVGSDHRPVFASLTRRDRS